MTGLDDTIAAIATPPGRGAIALLRVSGPAAVECLCRLAPDLSATPPPPRRQTLLALRHPETQEQVDHALVTVFPAPRSYTGEDVVEISTHGGVLSPQRVLDALLAAGARPALPGEFTRRALLNGKMDLLQAEAIQDLIDAASPARHRAALLQMDRGLSDRIEALRAAIVQLEALIAYSIDFPEEDEPPVPISRVHETAADVAGRIRSLLETAAQGEMLREGALLVLAGLPNSGKSSLFNALLGAERAIVTEVPGTTRDAIEAGVAIEGYPFRLVDTAGLRETTDAVEEIGIEYAQRYLQAADLVLFCAESGRSLLPEEADFLRGIDEQRVILVRTMTDRLPGAGAARLADEGTVPAGDAANHRDRVAPTSTLRPGAMATSIAVSARSGEGLGELGSAILARAFGNILADTGQSPLVTRERHARALRSALAELEAFATALQKDVPPELAATHLGAAESALRDLIGAIHPDDVLDRVFGQFCVGK